MSIDAQSTISKNDLYEEGKKKKKKTAILNTALHTLLIMTAEFILSKHPVLRITVVLFFSLSHFRPIFNLFYVN